jgi:hypothetical protein
MPNPNPDLDPKLTTKSDPDMKKSVWIHNAGVIDKRGNNL